MNIYPSIYIMLVLFVYLSGVPQYSEHCNTEHGPMTTGNAPANTITVGHGSTTSSADHGISNARNIIVTCNLCACWLLSYNFFS